MTHRLLLAIALMLAVCVFSLEAGPPRAVPHPAVPHPVAPAIRPPQAGPPRLPQPQVNPQMQKGMGQMQKGMGQMQKELNQIPKGLKDGMDQLRKGELPAGDLLKGVQKGAKGAAMKAPHLPVLKPIPVTSAQSLKQFHLHHRAKVFEVLHARHHGHWHRHHGHHWPWGYYLPIGGAAGQVVEVPSGNMLVVLNRANERTSVRLFGTGTPVFGQAFFSESQENLNGLAKGKFVNVVEVGHDADGTLVAQVFLQGEETYLSHAQIRQGMGWYAYDDGEAPDLAAAEEEAQSEGRGLWSNPDAPWEYSG